MTAIPAHFVPALERRRFQGRCFVAVCILLSLLAVVLLAVLLGRVFEQGWSLVSWDFLTRFPSQNPAKAGIKSAFAGSLWLMGLTTVVSIPIGVGAAIYLEEYARKNRFTRIIELNTANLAGIPSIVFGILGLSLFVRWFSLGRCILAASFTLSLLILPVIIIASREALRGVPPTIRHAAYALGATRWQVVRSHVLPAALPGIMTGVILALSRAIGEAAPLIMIGAVMYVAFLPEGPMDTFTALPLQIFNWAFQPQESFQDLAAAAIIVLLGILLPMNAVAVAVRAWQQRNKVW